MGRLILGGGALGFEELDADEDPVSSSYVTIPVSGSGSATGTEGVNSSYGSNIVGAATVAAVESVTGGTNVEVVLVSVVSVFVLLGVTTVTVVLGVVVAVAVLLSELEFLEVSASATTSGFPSISNLIDTSVNSLELAVYWILMVAGSTIGLNKFLSS